MEQLAAFHSNHDGRSSIAPDISFSPPLPYLPHALLPVRGHSPPAGSNLRLIPVRSYATLGAVPSFSRERRAALFRFGQAWTPTVRYCMETEVHVYAFSIAANVLLAFFPFLIVMVSLCRHVLNFEPGVAAIELALLDFFPEQVGEFIWNNLRATVASRGPMQITSLVLLLFTANGIFEPLEVALNRAWGAPNRSYLKNQIISLGLIFLCGGIALVSFVFTALNRNVWAALTGDHYQLSTLIGLAFFKAAAIPLTILTLFLVYWLLPNRKVSKAGVLPAAILVGLALEALKYASLVLWPWLRMKLRHEYGPFMNSVTIVLWSFAAAMIVLAGAEWSARRIGIAGRLNVDKL